MGGAYQIENMDFFDDGNIELSEYIDNPYFRSVEDILDQRSKKYD